MMKECHLTLDSVAKMTTYELRREVEKRGLLGELSIIDHSTLLRKLVQVGYINLNAIGPVLSLIYTMEFCPPYGE